MSRHADIAVIGAGAAGLMASIWAGRSARGRSIVALDGARTLGAKILVAGGGRCNVTHFEVDESAYAGSSRHAIKKVLRQFDVPRTVEFFREQGVELKREETGKLFPVTDRARTVLEALLAAAGDAGVEVEHPWRVEGVERVDGGFLVRQAVGSGQLAVGRLGATDAIDSLPPAPSLREGEWIARRVILATGGMSLPKTGSDGQGYAMARALGHSITPRVLPALVPLTLPGGHFLCELSGIAVPATIELRSATGKRLESFTNSTLFTHFGLSGPSVLDISRYWLSAPTGSVLVLNCLPGQTAASVDAALVGLGNATPLRWLAARMPERLARALCAHAGVDAGAPGHQLTRERRRGLAAALTELPLPITGSRGFAHAEVTAGGVPLSEIHLETMESRVCPGLHLCGEICDVDGRIGGFNFQWAWASGYVAGRGAAEGLSAGAAASS